MWDKIMKLEIILRRIFLSGEDNKNEDINEIKIKL